MDAPLQEVDGEEREDELRRGGQPAGRCEVQREAARGERSLERRGERGREHRDPDAEPVAVEHHVEQVGDEARPRQALRAVAGPHALEEHEEQAQTEQPVPVDPHPDQSQFAMPPRSWTS